MCHLQLQKKEFVVMVVLSPTLMVKQGMHSATALFLANSKFAG